MDFAEEEDFGGYYNPAPGFGGYQAYGGSGQQLGGGAMDPNDIKVADPSLPQNLQVAPPELQRLVQEETANYRQLERTNPKRLVYGDARIYPVQFVMASVFCRTGGGTSTAVFAKKGFGKTLFAYEIARQIADRGENCLIAVPTQTLSTWWNQGEDFDLLTKSAQGGVSEKGKRRTAPTTFFVYDVSMAADHVSYLDLATPYDLQNRKGLVIIAKDRSLLAGYRGVVGEGERKEDGTLSAGAMDIFVKRGGPLTIIVDEGHMDKKYVDQIKETYARGKGGPLWVERVVYMSGSDVSKLEVNYTMKTNLIGRLPFAKWIFYESPTPYFDPRSREWYDMLYPIFAQLNRIAVSATDDNFLAMEQSGLFAGYDVMKAVTGKTAEGRFAGTKGRNQQLKKVAHLTTRQGKGLNLLGDGMVIMNVNELSIDSLIQLASRLLRPNNPNREVYIFAFSAKGARAVHYKAYYASAFTYHGWEMGYDKEANSQAVAKALVLIKALGKDTSLLSTADKCVVLANYLNWEMTDEEKFKYVLEWHTKHAALLGEGTVLDEERIRAYTI